MSCRLHKLLRFPEARRKNSSVMASEVSVSLDVSSGTATLLSVSLSGELLQTPSKFFWRELASKNVAALHLLEGFFP